MPERSTRELERENAALRRRLESEVRKRLRYQNEAAVHASRAKALKGERDAAVKRRKDQDAGVAKLLADLQTLGAAYEALKVAP